MNITVAEHAGFCFGVSRAVEDVEKQISEAKKLPIYTYGPIIHNETVVEDFKKKGVCVIDENASLSEIEPGTVIIRSHGVSKKVMNELEEAGFNIVDATCPFVKKIHRIVEQYSSDGYKILIIGNESHPEVQGIIGWVANGDYIVVNSKEEAEALSFGKNTKICLVAQTTYNFKKFQELVEIITQKGYDIVAVSTICNATEERQTEAAQIAQNVDVMLVIGGKSSSNSQKLFEICKAECDNTYFIQTADDFDPSVLQSIHNIGITAGASTPKKIIEEVQLKCQN